MPMEPTCFQCCRPTARDDAPGVDLTVSENWDRKARASNGSRARNAGTYGRARSPPHRQQAS